MARRLLRTESPDLLLTYNWGAIEWAAANIPRIVRHIHTEDGFGPDEATGQHLRRVIFRRLVLNRHSTVVLPSRTLVRIATNLWRIHPDHVQYIPNGIPVQRIASATPDQGLVAKLKGEGLVLGTVATLRREKALTRLIDAFAQVLASCSMVRLVIVGDGPERQALETYTSNLGLAGSITFLGQIERPESILRAMDIFAISSDTEQMPLSVLEAMAAGLPIASTDVGDIADMVAADNRAFVSGRDTEQLAASIRKLVTDQRTRQHIGEANQVRAEKEYDISRMFVAHGALWSGYSNRGQQ